MNARLNLVGWHFTRGWLAQAEAVDGPVCFGPTTGIGITPVEAAAQQIRVAAFVESSVYGALVDPAPLCTGVTATWCPVHGDCTCPPDPDPEYLNADGCPLHDTASAHPRPTQEA